VLYKTHALDEAWRHLETGVDMCRQVDMPEGAALGLLWMATIRQVQGAEEAARELVEQARPFMKRTAQTMAGSLLTTLAVRLTLMQDSLDDRAISWASEQEIALGQDASEGGFVQRRFELLTLSRVWIEQGRRDQARDLLDRLVEVLRASGHRDHLIEALALQAMLLAASGDQQGALESLNRALAPAKAGGYVRPFIDLGEPMRALLLEAIAQLDEREYTHSLVAAFEAPAAPSLPAGSRPQALLEPLTELELAILRLVAAGMTNPEIASERFVTVNTVKWHLKNIYGKLGVHSRTEAVNRARDLDLL